MLLTNELKGKKMKQNLSTEEIEIVAEALSENISNIVLAEENIREDARIMAENPMPVIDFADFARQHSLYDNIPDLDFHLEEDDPYFGMDWDQAEKYVAQEFCDQRDSGCLAFDDYCVDLDDIQYEISSLVFEGKA
jgi:hypothetical protein